jgi:hypothetical protein
LQLKRFKRLAQLAPNQEEKTKWNKDEYEYLIEMETLSRAKKAKGASSTCPTPQKAVAGAPLPTPLHGPSYKTCFYSVRKCY